MAKNNTISPARIAAFDVLKQIEDGTFSSVALAAREPELSLLDRALCHELVLGVLRWQLQLDRIIEHFAGRKSDALDPPVLRALRLGLYQLRFLSRIPASAAVNESVNLVSRARLSSARAFVNAVLRRAAREDEYSPQATIADPIERITIETSHPRWLIERWSSAFGIEQAQALARANNEASSISFRVVSTVANEASVVERLSSIGAELGRSNMAVQGWRVVGGSAALREMSERGEIYLQDEASQLVGEVVAACVGDRVLDMCAAPGGKSTLVAERVGATTIVAMDASPRRLATVRSTADLHRLPNIDLIVADAGESLPFADESFACVLLDAPCSGTGTLRHNPEIRWRLTEADIGRLGAQQVRFLMNAARVVRPGGVLFYSTCSVERDENESVVERFLAANGAFKQMQVPVHSSLLTESGALRTWPHQDKVDGFYLAVLKRE